MDKALIIGCGDIGRRVAALCMKQGQSVHALVRSTASAATLSAQGIKPDIGDLDDATTLPSLSSGQAMLYYFAPPPAQGVDDPRMAGLLNHLSGASPPRKIVYISTSGVYGDCKGAWVSEDTPPHPGTDRARRRLAAEQLLHDYEQTTGVPVVILRVGGIYGPGRLPIERLRQGTPVLREQDCGYTNRIHADDLAVICIAAAERGHGVYNVCDGHPSTMTDYFNQVADRYGLPRPPQIGMSDAKTRLSAEMLSYLEESRRMDNRKLTEELRVVLRYPALKEGLAQIELYNDHLKH